MVDAICSRKRRLHSAVGFDSQQCGNLSRARHHRPADGLRERSVAAELVEISVALEAVSSTATRHSRGRGNPAWCAMDSRLRGSD